jgi:hypothetical protein
MCNSRSIRASNNPVAIRAFSRGSHAAATHTCTATFCQLRSSSWVLSCTTSWDVPHLLVVKLLPPSIIQKGRHLELLLRRVEQAAPAAQGQGYLPGRLLYLAVLCP